MVYRKAAMGDEGDWQLAKNSPILFIEYTMRNHSTIVVAGCSMWLRRNLQNWQLAGRNIAVSTTTRLRGFSWLMLILQARQSVPHKW